MTADDWAALEAAFQGGPPAAPATKEPAEPRQDPPRSKVRTSDEIVAEEIAKAGRLPAELPDILQPACPPTSKGALVGPANRAQHLPPVRLEIVELRREVADLTRMVAEIHARVVVEGGKP